MAGAATPVLRGSRAVLQDAVPDSERARPHAARRQASFKLENVPEFNGTAKPPPTPLTLLRDLRTAAHVARRRGAPAPQRSAESRRDARRIGAGRRVHLPRQRRTGARQPARRRHVHLDGSRRSRRRPPTRWSTSTSSRTSRSSSSRRRTCSTGWTKSSRTQQKKVEESERGAGRVSRQAERDVARRQAEHRRCRGSTQLNDAVDRKAKTERVQKESLYNQIKPLIGERRPVARRDSGHRAERRRCSAQDASSPSCSARRASCSRSYRRQAPAGACNVNAQIAGHAAAARARDAESAPVGQERLRHGACSRNARSRRTSRRPRPTRRT